MNQAPSQSPVQGAPQVSPEAEWLSQMRDIHAAPDVPIWPPAPGWWMLAAVLLALLGWLAFRAWRSWRLRRRRRMIAGRLEAVAAARDPAQEPSAWLADINQFLKWVAIRAFPGECEDLQGSAWVAFLADRAQDSDRRALAVLESGPYQPAPDFDAGTVLGAARGWVLAHG